MKNILYATDFSEKAERAFDIALKIANDKKAKLYLLHVHDIPTTWEYSHMEDFSKVIEKIKHNSSKKFDALLKKHVAGKVPLVEYLEVENRSVSKGIESAIEEHDIDLLVIGTRGESKLHEVIMGSTTKAMVEKSICPVLAIPEETTSVSFKHVLYASDLRDKDLEAIKQLVDFLKPYQPKITIVHIINHEEIDGEKKLERFKRVLEENLDYKHFNYQPLLSDKIYERLSSYLNRNGFDLLVMLEKEKEGLTEKIFRGDSIKKMEFHTSVPLLSFNEHYLKTF